ncbi:hypothetical protein LPJ68_001415, partial [Coemansia sp. RSA 1086]
PGEDACDDYSIRDVSIVDDDDDDARDACDSIVGGGGGGGGDEGDAESEGSDAAATGSVFGGTAGQKRRTRATAAAAAAAAAAATAAGPRSELVSDISVQPSVPIRRIRWNSTGTLLVSSSDDGVVRMWRMTPSGTWREMAAVSAESA